MSRAMPLNVHGVPINRRERIPCRCSKCGSRKTLAKYPEEYRYGLKKCHGFTCDGTMRVDRYRLQAQYDIYKRNKDSGPQCCCDGHPRMHPRGKVNFDLRYVCHWASDEKKEELRKSAEDEIASERAYEKSIGL